MMRRHAELLVEAFGEDTGCVDLRKHIAWYLKGFAVGGEARLALAHVSHAGRAATSGSRALDLDQPYPAAVLGAPARPHEHRQAGRAAGRLAGRPRRVGGAERGRDGPLGG